MFDGALEMYWFHALIDIAVSCVLIFHAPRTEPLVSISVTASAIAAGINVILESVVIAEVSAFLALMIFGHFIVALPITLVSGLICRALLRRKLNVFRDEEDVVQR